MADRGTSPEERVAALIKRLGIIEPYDKEQLTHYDAVVAEIREAERAATAELQAKVEGLEASHEDEEAAHAETLDMLKAAQARATAAESALAEARRERDDYRDRWKQLVADMKANSIDGWAQAARSAQRERDEARAALRKYSGHLWLCVRRKMRAQNEDEYKCTCGLDAALPRAGGEVPAADWRKLAVALAQRVPCLEPDEGGRTCAEQDPEGSLPHCEACQITEAAGPIAPAAPVAGEQRQEAEALAAREGFYRRHSTHVPAPTPKDPEEGR